MTEDIRLVWVPTFDVAQVETVPLDKDGLEYCITACRYYGDIFPQHMMFETREAAVKFSNDLRFKCFVKPKEL
jgi:hypothetical protein